MAGYSARRRPAESEPGASSGCSRRRQFEARSRRWPVAEAQLVLAEQEVIVGTGGREHRGPLALAVSVLLVAATFE